MNASQIDNDGLTRLSAAVVDAARKHGFFLATAESCTAGALAHLLANAPGAGEILQGGFVTYTKANKTAALAVPKALILNHSAVSAEVARSMAKRAA